MDVRSYLAIEVGLTRRLVRDWTVRSQAVYRDIQNAVEAGEYREAVSKVHLLSLEEVGEDNREYIRRMLLASALFGAKMANKRGALYAASPDHDPVIDQAVENMLRHLKYRGTDMLRARVLQLIAVAETEDKTQALGSVQKSNPYHDELGRCTDRSRAKHSVAVSNYRTGHFRHPEDQMSGVDGMNYSSSAQEFQQGLLSSTGGRRVTTYRGVRGSYAEKLLRLSVGDTFGGDARFVSTDTDPSVADFYMRNGPGDKMIIEVRLQPDTVGKDIGGVHEGGGSEVVLPAGTVFRVIEVKPATSRGTIFGVERQGHIVVESVPQKIAQKYNPYHDEQGLFTFAPGGRGSAFRSVREAPIDALLGGSESIQVERRLHTVMYEAYKPWLDGLTGSQVQAVETYMGAAYEDINRGLRTGLGSVYMDTISELDSALEAAGKTEEDLTVYRGLSAKVTARLLAGGVITDDGYLSTSIKPITAAKFSVNTYVGGHNSVNLLRIKVPKGTIGAYISVVEGVSYGGEAEFLLGRGQTIRLRPPPTEVVITPRFKRPVKGIVYDAEIVHVKSEAAYKVVSGVGRFGWDDLSLSMPSRKEDIQAADLQVAGAKNSQLSGGPQPLYVSRRLKNPEAFIAWAKSQGFSKVVNADDLHVTIAYSRESLAWDQSWVDHEPLVCAGGSRTVEPLGSEGAVVLHFDCNQLQEAWEELRVAGASWDYQGYHPHITITYDVDEGLDLTKIKSYTGPLEFYGEVFEALDTDWKDSVVEKADAGGRFVQPFQPFVDPGIGELQIAASLNTSRLSTWGFTTESLHLGRTRYQLTAVLDGRTSDFCRMINGRQFDVASARSLVTKVLTAKDPEDVKTLQPWPKQDRESMAKYTEMSDAQLQAAGLGIPPFHPMCYVAGTQVYTRRGFVDFSDVDISSDLFLSLDTEDRSLKWVSAIKKMEYQYSGEVLRFSNNQGSLLQMVTPDHTMLWERRVDSGKGGRSRKMVFGTVGEFLSSNRKEAKVYCSSGHKGTSPATLMFAGRMWPTKPLLKFLGYYLSEGSVQYHSDGRYCYPVIAQTKYANKMFSDISRLCPGVRKHEHISGHKLAVSDAVLGAACAVFGKSHSKYVPEWVFSLSPDLIRVFLDAYILGDGSRREKGSKFFGFHSEERTITTSSVRMRDGLVELMIRAGGSASFRRVSSAGTQQVHGNGVYTQNYDQWRVSWLTSKARAATRVEVVPYEGTVYDVELEHTHTLLVQLEGRVSWGSNCRTLCTAVEGEKDLGVKAPRLKAPAGVLEEKVPAQAFTVVSPEITVDNLQQWNDYIGKDPIKVIKMLFGTTVEDALKGGVVTFDKSGNIVLALSTPAATIRQVLDPYTGTLYLSEAQFAAVNGEKAARAYFTRVLHGMVEAKDTLGATTIVVATGDAAVEFAHLGFVPKASDWQALRLEAMDDFQDGSLNKVYLALDDDQKKTVMNLLSNENEHALTDLMALPFIYRNKTVGEWILQGYEGDFYLDLLDKDLVKRIGGQA